MPGWYPGEYQAYPSLPPHYSTMPSYLRVVDRIKPQLIDKRRDVWLAARDRGLAQWAPVGFKIRIKSIGDYDANRVTLNFAEDVDPRLGAWHCFEACAPCSKPGCDWIHILPSAFEALYLSGFTARLQYWVAHEFGHSLGFGHGGDGIMDQTPEHAQVNAEEIAAAKTYWGIK